MEKPRLSYTSSSNVKWCSHFEKSRSSNRVTTWCSSTHPRHTPKRNENIHPHIKLHTVYTVALFITTRERKEPKCSSSDEWIKQCGVDFKCILFSHKKKVRNTWYNRDEPWKHYATGKEASHNRLHITWFTSWEMSRAGASIEVISVVAQDWGIGRDQLRYGVYFWGDILNVLR